MKKQKTSTRIPEKIIINLSPDYRFGVCAILIPKWIELAYHPKTWKKVTLTISKKSMVWKPITSKRQHQFYLEYTKRSNYKKRAKIIEEREEAFWDKYWECKDETHKNRVGVKKK